MARVVISENVSLDGVVEDPAGDEGFERGGWVGLIKDRPELNQLALDEARGRSVSPGSAQLPVVRRSQDVAKRRIGRSVEQHAQVRRVVDPRRARLEQLDGASGRPRR
jgi:hypothetical protein